MSGGGHGHNHHGDHHHGEHHGHHQVACCGGANCGVCVCCCRVDDGHTHPPCYCETKEEHDEKCEGGGGVAWPWIIACVLLGIATITFIVLWYMCATYQPTEASLWCGPAPTQSSSAGEGSGGAYSGVPVKAGKSQIDLQVEKLPDWDKVKKRLARVPANSSDYIASATQVAIAEADGSPVAGNVYAGIPLTPEERVLAPYAFWQQNESAGVLGFYRLALAFLGPDAFDIAHDADRADHLYVPFCRTSATKFVPMANIGFAYVYFAMIDDQCNISGKPDVKAWMEGLRRRYPRQSSDFNRWDNDAEWYFATLMKNGGLDPDDQGARGAFCTGIFDDPNNKHQKESCEDAFKSRQALKYGDAADAQGDKESKEKARVCWRKAIELAMPRADGSDPEDPEGAPAAILAQKRLQTSESTCKWTPDSLAAISRDYKARSGDLIHIRVLQQSLKALGHYDGTLDGQLSPQTRAAIRKFQREREEDETDTLTPEQTVGLVCHAAETARDVVSQTTLGIMYATGLGVEQNIDQAHYWLTNASNQHYADATYNLAILYGTGIILDSYRLCDVAHSPEQADKFLQEAAEQGHPIAQALWKKYGPGSNYANLTPQERWTLIESQQLSNSSADTTGLYAHRLAVIGTKCAPDRSIR